MYVYIFIAGTGKSRVVQLIERDMTYFLKNVLNADPDQPIVLMTAPTGSAAYRLVRVATAQGKQGIWLLTFPDRENTGNLVNLIFYTGKIVATQGKF